METIGNRAYKEIKNRARENGISPSKEAMKLLADSRLLSAWKRDTNPSAYYLQQMSLAGYDVIYILTGRRQGDA